MSRIDHYQSTDDCSGIETLLLLLIVNHYHDEAMEEARRECVCLIGIKADGDPRRLAPEDIRRLHELAAALN